MSAVLLSGGWESALCLIQAISKGGEVFGYFYDYGQPYAKQEYDAVERLRKKFKFKLLINLEEPFKATNGVFANRNEYFIRDVAMRGHKDIYFGCRNLLNMMDKYGDSNKQFAMRMAKELGVKIHTPALLMPKFMVKSYVLEHGVTEKDIYSSEGYKYETK